jgi:hypothetical protein
MRLCWSKYAGGETSGYHEKKAWLVLEDEKNKIYNANTVRSYVQIFGNIVGSTIKCAALL